MFSEDYQYLKTLAQKGGPDPTDYENLNAFFSGKLRVVIHRAPLTLVGERSRETTAAYPSNQMF